MRFKKGATIAEVLWILAAIAITIGLSTVLIKNVVKPSSNVLDTSKNSLIKMNESIND